MPDNIEQVIRRDLDELPVLPAERWIPEPPGWPTVLGRGMRRAGLAAVVLVLALAAGTAIAQIRAGVWGIPQAATQQQRTEPPIARCSDGRPQSEIDFAGRMLWEPTANEIRCVLNATVSGPGANRAYRLTDGRVIGIYERVETLPVKPTVAPVATGTAEVNGVTWSWSTLPAGPRQTLLLQGSLAGAPDIELSMELSDQAADLRLLRSIAASLRQVAPSTAPSPSASPARTAVLERFSRITSEIRRVDRIDAKLMTRREFEQASGPNGTSTSPNWDPNQVIWVVAISGEVVPQFSRGLVFPWGIYLVSVDSGDIIGMRAGAGPWPSYFDGLPDREPR